MTVEQVPEPAVVDGKPQGIFVGRSLLTGRAVCLLFLADGRASRAIPKGGLASFDWARHAADRPADCGTWATDSGQLTISWADGGVHQGPLTVHEGAIEFYGKRYAMPRTVQPAELVGRWEAASGSAIAGGAGINRLSTLVVEPGGRYHWAEAAGGVVQGLAVAGGSSDAGTVVVAGQTVTFTADAGPSTAHTFLAAAGDRLEAFSLDGDLFTRVG